MNYSKLTLQTDRCEILGLSFTTPKDYLQFLVENRDEFSPTIPAQFRVSVFGLPFWEKSLPSAPDDFTQRKMVRVFARRRGFDHMALTINFSEFRVFPDSSCVVGFLCHKDFVGQGLVKECLLSMFQWLKIELKVRRVYSYHLPDNLRSDKTLRSLDFEPIGLIKGFCQLDGRWHDHVYSSLILDDRK